jgi:hypothetical protein
MFAEPTLVSPSLPSPSRGGHPYKDLEGDARSLAVRLEFRALRTEYAPERKRLRVLAAAQIQIAQCLAGVGVKNA